MTYVTTVRSKTECSVTFDDIELTFRMIGTNLTLAAKMRHGGRQLRSIPNHLYKGAKDASRKALDAYKQEESLQSRLFA